MWTKKNIRRLRIALGLRQEEFGALLGLSAQRVSDLETGYRKPSGPVRILLGRLENKRKGGTINS